MEEIKVERATEVDVRLMFETLFKPLEALQKLLVAEAKRLSDDGVDTSRVEIEIKPKKLTLRIGDVVLYHEVTMSVYDFAKLREQQKDE